MPEAPCGFSIASPEFTFLQLLYVVIVHNRSAYVDIFLHISTQFCIVRSILSEIQHPSPRRWAGVGGWVGGVHSL